MHFLFLLNGSQLALPCVNHHHTGCVCPHPRHLSYPSLSQNLECGATKFHIYKMVDAVNKKRRH